jgi:hypothetical protein
VALPTDRLPKRYYIDESGRKYLVGLSVEETFEFEALGDIPPLDDSGWCLPWQEDVPITPREKRWLELYQKHQRAWWALVAAVATRRKT